MRRAYRANPMLEKTINVTTGIVGVGVASSVAAGLPAGLARTITTSGTLPIMGLGVMQEAGRTRRRK